MRKRRAICRIIFAQLEMRYLSEVQVRNYFTLYAKRFYSRTQLQVEITFNVLLLS